jgi:hypothetical protein
MPAVITSANRFCNPGSANVIVRKWIEAFDEAVRDQRTRLGSAALLAPAALHAGLRGIAG